MEEALPLQCTDMTPASHFLGPDPETPFPRDHVLVLPLLSMADHKRGHIEWAPEVHRWPEVGSRAMQRPMVRDDAIVGGWVTIQQGCYRCLGIAEGSLMVRGVISEYLAFEVIWQSPEGPLAPRRPFCTSPRHSAVSENSTCALLESLAPCGQTA